MKRSMLAVLLLSLALSSGAFTKEDIFKESNTITWLGIDFTQLKFIGTAAQWQDAGEITNSAMRDKYFPAWNNLITEEPKKFDVPSAVHRSGVAYALDVTEKANNATKNNFFTSNANDYQLLTEDKVKSLVSKYNFAGKKGIGMMFFVEGMSKGKEEASMWVTFVDMGTKKVLLTERITAKSGGFGFRNYWAKAIANGLKRVNKEYSNWEN